MTFAPQRGPTFEIAGAANRLNIERLPVVAVIPIVSGPKAVGANLRLGPWQLASRDSQADSGIRRPHRRFVWDAAGLASLSHVVPSLFGRTTLNTNFGGAPHASAFSSIGSGWGMPFEMRHNAACTLSAMRAGSGSGQPDTACGFTPIARAAAVALPPSSRIASVLSMPLLNHAFTENAIMISWPPATLGAMSDFGERLQLAIEHAKTDRKTLAKAIGITVQAVGQAINFGKFSAHNTAKAARFCGVNWYWLATGEESMSLTEGVYLTDDDRQVLRRVLDAAEPAPAAQPPAPSVGSKYIKSGKLASSHRVIAGPHIKPAKSKDAKTNKPKR